MPKRINPVIEMLEQDADSPDTAVAEAYWKSRFAEPVAVLDLPTDRPRPALKSFNGSMERVMLDAAFLLRRAKVKSFQTAVRAQAKKLGELGYQLTLTGPWPPYNFVVDAK